MTSIRAHFFDTVFGPDGRPLSSPTVDVFEPGTTVPIGEPIYANDEGATELANPFLGDERGNVSFFLTSPRQVDIRYTRAGHSSYTRRATVQNASPFDELDFVSWTTEFVVPNTGPAGIAFIPEAVINFVAPAEAYWLELYLNMPKVTAGSPAWALVQIVDGANAPVRSGYAVMTHSNGTYSQPFVLKKRMPAAPGVEKTYKARAYSDAGGDAVTFSGFANTEPSYFTAYRV